MPGTNFRFAGKPVWGWSGVVYCEVIVVYCEVIEVDAPRSLRYSWRGDEDTDDVTEVTYRLEPTAAGTRFSWAHTGFTGAGGFAMSRLLGSVRRKMLNDGVPAVLAAYHAEQAS
ncbi:SRPBCC family protein [Paractinoplanes atraurantiacus]|uniref:Activator of Hsp90 ATPase homolog 1-like protein n=1 Tax=Paractinoplanes atraurantiacus TaxID=1036182 RepID=A0A285K1X6_9ACTN|nr:Activator of Hsp90 ATPase homolog 1-like protein [Actinoplanes atraurantiacus]